MQKQSLTVEALQEHVIQHFSEKRRQNPQYSVARLAKELNIKTPSLQKLLTGKRKLGYLMAVQIARSLKVDVVKDPEKKTRTSKWSAWKLRPLPDDGRAQLSWVNFAILEMLKLKDFQPTSAWVARRLGLSQGAVDEILISMESDGLLKRDGDKWSDELENSTVAAAGFVTSAKLRDLQKHILQSSVQALETVDYAEREHSFTMFPVSKSNIEKIKRKIRDFRVELTLLEQNSNLPKDDVYSLQVCLFPLTLSPANEKVQHD